MPKKDVEALHPITRSVCLTVDLSGGPVTTKAVPGHPESLYLSLMTAESLYLSLILISNLGIRFLRKIVPVSQGLGTEGYAYTAAVTKYVNISKRTLMPHAQKPSLASLC